MNAIRSLVAAACVAGCVPTYSFGAADDAGARADAGVDAPSDAPPPELDGGACGVLRAAGGTAIALPRTYYDVTTFTIEAWVRPRSFSATRPENIASHWGDGSPAVSTGSWALFVDDQHRPALGISCDGTLSSTNVVGSPSPLVDGVWTHVAAMFDGATSTIHILLNGQQVNEQAIGCNRPHGVGLAAPFEIALDDSHGGGGPFTGDIDEVRLSSALEYTKSVTPPARLPRTPSTLALYHFDGPSGASSSPDDSVNANDLQIGPDVVVAESNPCR